MKDQQPSIIDGENYRSTQSNYGFREIVLNQVQRITNIYSQELTEGFWKRSQMNEYGNQEVTAYIPDGRESYINAVDCLYDLLLPKFDKTMKDDAKDINDEITKECDALVERKNKGEKIPKKTWIMKRIDLKRKMFQKICLLLERLGWLEEESVGED